MRATRFIPIALVFLLGARGMSYVAAQSRRGGTNASPASTFDPLAFGGPDKNTSDMPFVFTEAGSQAPDVQAIWRVIWHFEDISISRPQLLEQTEAFLKQFPASEHAERARETVAMLRKMIAEDEARAKAVPRDLGELPVEQRVSELIFRLRDQNGSQNSQPGFCDIFADVRRSTNTPAHQLVRIGYPAVPQLIAALDDGRFTRSVGFWRNFRFSHHVLTVGDCALAILQRISGRSFYERRTTSSYLSVDGDREAVRKEVEAWYADFQKTGEKQLLIQETEAGSASSPAPAKMLPERYPDAAADVIIKAVQAVKTMSRDEAESDLEARGMAMAVSENSIQSTINRSEAPRQKLLELLATSEIKDERVTQFLSQELRAAPDLPSRIAAADGLRRRGRPEGVVAMIQEWPEMVKERVKRGDADFVTMVNFHALEGFLGSSDSPESIRALGGSMRQLDAQDRLGIVGAIAPNRQKSTGEITTKPSAATLDVIEEVLVSALNDTESAVGTSSFVDGRSYRDSRICDQAGYYLAQSWPDWYQFDLPASHKIHERQRIQCLNAWRTAHEEAALPMPVEVTNHVSEVDAVKVTLIEWADDGVKPSDAFVARIGSLKDKLLTATAFTEVIRDFQADPEPGTSGLELQALKDEDLTGVKIRVRLLPGKDAAQARGWSYHKHVRLGDEDLLSNSSSGGIRFDLPGDLRTFAGRAIAAPPTTPFLIQATVTAYPGMRR